MDIRQIARAVRAEIRRGHWTPDSLARAVARVPAPTCATCQHYSGEGCADTRKHPMQHKVCPPTWGCPRWEGKP